MKRRFRRNAIEADVDMTPMLDIVFIMLIFFIVTATFFDEGGIKMTQPQGAHAGAKSISVYLYADGSATLDGIRVGINNIPDRVHSIRAEEPQAVVILGADRKTAHGKVTYLKDRLDSAHIPVSLKVRME